MPENASKVKFYIGNVKDCELIAEGKPLTITNPDMTRFMMTLHDAIELVCNVQFTTFNCFLILFCTKYKLEKYYGKKNYKN